MPLNESILLEVQVCQWNPVVLHHPAVPLILLVPDHLQDQEGLVSPGREKKEGCMGGVGEGGRE